MWDYHVILHHSGRIYDFDSTLSFPCDVNSYIAQTMIPEIPLRQEFQRLVFWCCIDLGCIELSVEMCF
jgi:hypothetical protein